MKIISWNVNGIKSVIENGFLKEIKRSKPIFYIFDICCMYYIFHYSCVGVFVAIRKNSIF